MEVTARWRRSRFRTPSPDLCRSALAASETLLARVFGGEMHRRTVRSTAPTHRARPVDRDAGLQLGGGNLLGLSTQSAKVATAAATAW